MKIQNYTKIIVGLYLISFVFSVIYPRPSYHLVSFLDYVGCTLNLLTIFLGGSVAYLIRDKFVFNIKYVLLSVIFCIIVMSFVPYIFAIEICALPMTYIILYISINLKSPKFIQRNDISYGIYIYAWPIQTVLNVYITVSHITINVFEFMILSILISVIFGLLSWFIFEKPILNKTKEILKSK